MTLLEDSPKAAESWFGTYRLSENSAGRWTVGPMVLWIQRLPGEWRVARLQAEDPQQERVAVEVPAEAPNLLELPEVERHAASGSAQSVTLTPALANRPVVARPEKPFHLPRGQETTVFVSSPLWVQLATEKNTAPIFDAPVFRPSDTWFGPSSMEGELCYASKSSLRFDLDNIPLRPHRAVTAVHIVNRSHTSLLLQSLRLPVLHLTLYRSEIGRFWTQDVTFERHRDGDFAALRIRKRKPTHAPEATKVAESRVSAEENPMVRAFSAIFS